MITITFLLLVLSFVCFVIAAANAPTRINLVALGLALYIATLLLARL